MSHKDKHPSFKQRRKVAIAARNKRDSRVNTEADLHEENERLEREREKELRDKAVKASRVDDAGHVVWSAQLQDIRNRLTGKKRMAKERWNRFAGTSGGGGRGL